MFRKFLISCLGLLLLMAPAFVSGAEKPSKAAFLQSLVLPGWGQYSLGKKNAALGFVSAEALLIGGMFTLRAYGASARDDYKAMAATYAGVMGDHDHDYYVDVGNWMNVDDFNERRLQERSFGELYTAEADRWEWDSDQHRAEMRNRRIKSDRALNSVLYLVGGLVLNHVASAIHAGRASVRMSRAQSSLTPPNWSVGLAPASQQGGMRILLSKNF
jgi:hypothetical protein